MAEATFHPFMRLPTELRAKIIDIHFETFIFLDRHVTLPLTQRNHKGKNYFGVRPRRHGRRAKYNREFLDLPMSIAYHVQLRLAIHRVHDMKMYSDFAGGCDSSVGYQTPNSVFLVLFRDRAKRA
jgi:hypothetical protein